MAKNKLYYYSRSYDYVPLPLQRYRDSPSGTVTDRNGPFTTVTERYQALLTVTESYRYKRYKRYINFFYKALNICSKGPILRPVTLVTQVTVNTVTVSNSQ